MSTLINLFIAHILVYILAYMLFW